jgi:hypothetical protein
MFRRLRRAAHTRRATCGRCVKVVTAGRRSDVTGGWAMLSLIALLIGADINRLGDDDFDTREDATCRLRWYGPLALPAPNRVLTQSADPEVLARARSIAQPWRSLWLDVQAASLILSDTPVDPLALWNDPTTRQRLARIIRATLGDWPASNLECDDVFNPWLNDWKPAIALNGLGYARQCLRGRGENSRP